VEPQLREEVKRLSLVVITSTTLLQKSIAEPPQKNNYYDVLLWEIQSTRSLR
jgi:hypothetical protein